MLPLSVQLCRVIPPLHKWVQLSHQTRTRKSLWSALTNTCWQSAAGGAIMFNCKNNLPFDPGVILHLGIDYEAELIYSNKRVVKDILIHLMKDYVRIKNVQTNSSFGFISSCCGLFICRLSVFVGLHWNQSNLEILHINNFWTQQFGFYA